MKRLVALLFLLAPAALCFGRHRSYLRQEPSFCEDIYTIEGVDENGDPELTAYYQVESYQDSVFLVVRQRELDQLAAYLDALHKKLLEWKRIANDNGIDRINREMPVTFPGLRVRWTTDEKTKYGWIMRHHTHDSDGPVQFNPSFTIEGVGICYVILEIAATENGMEYSNSLVLYDHDIRRIRRWADRNRLMRAHRKAQPKYTRDDLDRLFTHVLTTRY